MARPSLYTPEVVEEICHRLVEGESLRAICRDERMPGAQTVFDWLTLHEDFRSRYARARDIQGDLGFDYLQEIADDGSNDWMERQGADGQSQGWRENGEALGRSKLRVETLKWRLEKLVPKKYGPTNKIELTGKDGSALIPPVLGITFPDGGPGE